MFSAFKAAAILIGLGAGLALAQSGPATSTSQADANAEAVLNRGQQLTSTVASVTSTALSPLLGVCLLGIYDYWRAPETKRATLPLYDKPQFWIPISGLLVLIFLKDTIGGMVPLLKKPLDAIEVLVVNKASLILIAFPVMFNQVARLAGFKSVGDATAQAAALIVPVVHAADGSSWFTAGNVGAFLLMAAAGVIVTFIVWIVGHAADVLMLLSPFPFLDVAVKALRAAILLIIVGSALVDKRLGLAISLIVIAICAFLFSWALRVTIMGTMFAWDLIKLLMFKHRATIAPGDPIRGFTAGKLRGMPRYSYGKLTRDPNGILEFRYRRLSAGPTRLIRLDDAISYQIGRGLLYPSVVLPYTKGSNYTLQFRLLPRYNGVEEHIRSQLGLSMVRDLYFHKGLRAFKNWVAGNTGDSQAAAHGA